LGSKRRRIVSTFKGDYGTGNGSATGSIRAVTYSVAEIDVVARQPGSGLEHPRVEYCPGMLLKQVWPQEGREEIAVIVELVVIDDEEDVLVVVVWGKDFALLVVVMEDEDWVVEEVVLEEREQQLPN
jgi:hypothetical protein